MTHGIRDFEPTRRDWQDRLAALRTAEGQPLAPCLRAELLRECRRLRQVMEMIVEVEAEQKQAVAAEDGNAAQLARLRGIGLAFGTVLSDEVFFRDFRNRREVGGYITEPVVQRPGPARSGYCQIGQPAGATRRHRARLALAAPPAGQCARKLVPRSARCGEGTHAPDHVGGDGAQADHRVVTLSQRWHCPGWCRAEGLTRFATAAERGW